MIFQLKARVIQTVLQENESSIVVPAKLRLVESNERLKRVL